jgi:hypothetical protein
MLVVRRWIDEAKARQQLRRDLQVEEAVLSQVIQSNLTARSLRRCIDADVAGQVDHRKELQAMPQTDLCNGAGDITTTTIA